MANIDYGAILNRSWTLTKRAKWLWVYGLTLAVFAGSGSSGSGGGGGGGSSPSKWENLPKDIPQDLPEKTSKVLGETTNIIKDWLVHVPITTWLLIGLGIFALILLWIFVSWIVRSWATGGLIAGLEDADNDKPVTLASTSPRGIAAVKNLMIFGVLSTLISIALFFGMGIVLLFGYLLLKSIESLMIIWLVLGGTAAVITFIVAIILFTMVGIYAQRLIVLKKYSPWQAWKKGLSISKHQFIPTVVMGILNSAIGCGVGCASTVILVILLAIPAIILIIPMFKDGFHLPGIPTILGLGLLFMIFVYVNYMINALLYVFKYSNWNLLFKQISSEEKV